MNPADVLAAIPGWSGARIERLDGGLSNDVWMVDNGRRRGVLKVDPVPRGRPFNDRNEEARIQAVAAAAGLAAPVIFSSKTILLTGYLDGEVWSAHEFADDCRLDALARALRTLHALPPTGRLLDIRGAAQDYAACISGVPATTVDGWLRIVDAAPRPATAAFCHNDLVAANILSTPEIRFLDWEYACDNDPVFDLGIVVAHHDLDGPRADRLLDAYHDGAGPEQRERLAEYRRLYEALNCLWAAARYPAG